VPAGLTPEDIFHYAYAVLHSPGYRSRYAEFLKTDFPRLPLTGNLELFRALALLGGELTALHLLESSKLAQPITEFNGSRNSGVEKISWSRDTVWVDKAQTTGFHRRSWPPPVRSAIRSVSRMTASSGLRPSRATAYAPGCSSPRSSAGRWSPPSPTAPGASSAPRRR
jgi:hypothetical protein